MSNSISIWRTQVPVSQRVRVMNNFYGSEYSTTDVVLKPSFVAVVNGVEWTEKQTVQAIADASACRCGDCVCCDIKRLARRVA